MFDKGSKKLILFAAEKGHILKDEVEEYVYGLNLVLTVLLTDITTLIIGFIFRMPIESIVFWFIYKSLRKYGGGFHFNSPLKCYLSTFVMCPLALLLIKYCPFDTVVFTSITVLSTVIMFILAPIPAIEKPLDDLEFKVFGRRARIIMCISIAVYLLVSIKFLYASRIIAVSIWAVTLFGIMGKFKLMYYTKQESRKSV